jgi:OmpA-OmpF porin, OOP family
MIFVKKMHHIKTALLGGLSLILWDTTAQQSAENMGAAINSEYPELAPIIAPDNGILYFVRKNHPLNKFGVEGSAQYGGSQDVWFSENKNGAWTISRRMSDIINRDQFNTILSISPDGNRLLLQGAYLNGEYDGVGFSLSTRTANGWSIPQKIDIPKYEKMSASQRDYASLSADGTTMLLSFSTKKKGGDDDLWVVFQDEDGEWSEPMNLGDDVNTEFSETTPFLAPDGKTLYFSSNRTGGLGSNDIYVCKRLDDTWERWSEPTNLGPQINTEDFDAYFTLSASGEWAYFVTGKNTKGKKDIMRYKWASKGGSVPASKPAPVVAANMEVPKTNSDKDKKTKVETTNLNTEPVVMLSGKVIDPNTGRVPANAKVVYEDLATGKQLGVATPDPITGSYKLVLPYGKNYGISTQIEGYLPSSQNIDLSNRQGSTFLEIPDRDLSVTSIKPTNTNAEVRVVMNNLFFAFGKASLKEESFPELNRMAKVMNQNQRMIVEIGGHTDNVGSDEVNNKLSLERAEAVKNYLISKNVKADRILAKGYGKTRPIATNETEEGQAANRRVEFKIIRNQ